MHEPFDDVIRSLCSCAKSPSNATRSASSSPAARTPLTDTTSTQNSTTMSRHFKIITKEMSREHPIETEFVGDVDRAYLIKFFGRREPDVEWFRIEEIQKDRFREPQKRKAAGDCQPLCSE